MCIRDRDGEGARALGAAEIEARHIERGRKPLIAKVQDDGQARELFAKRFREAKRGERRAGDENEIDFPFTDNAGRGP